MARTRHLRVHIKELASEAKHIRHEESQCSGMEKWELQHHRKTVVRQAARKYQLAYACARGKAYRLIERTVKSDWLARRALEGAVSIALRFGVPKEDADVWHEDALAHLRGETTRKDPAPSEGDRISA
jgi:hypothetical protein